MADEPKTNMAFISSTAHTVLPVVYPMTAPELNAHAVV
uniref:Uncharacterized protein n=1 Tax=Anguilla anguilla TaxID=7936 RepID=A0A0E9QUI2_ANGAN